MSIQPLPGDVVAQIKSSIIITSVNGVASGLLQNSLDAAASKISISVDYSRGNCTVEDDGTGIPPSDFHENGGLGQLHYTSRYPPRADCHGRHGEFLASLGTLSLLTVASHHQEYRSCNCLTIHNSKVIARNVPALPEQCIISFAHGTRVTVRDLFGSMPVRVKQRAIEMERLGSAKIFDQLIHIALAMLLAWPAGISLSLRDLVSNRIIALRTSARSRIDKEIVREIPSRTCTLLGQATLLEREDPRLWVSIGASVSGISLIGSVCLLPVATKRVQFIALGIQPLLNENQSNVLYEEVNRVFTNSDFGVVEEAELDQDGTPKNAEGSTSKELRPKRGIDRWPMFFIQINLDDQIDSLNKDRLLEDSHRNLSMITDLLQVMVFEFLKKHHFRPKPVAAFERLKQPKAAPSKSMPPKSNTQLRASSGDRAPQNSSRSSARPEPRKPRSSRRSQPPQPSRESSGSPFASWARVKSGAASTTNSKQANDPSNTPSTVRDIRRPTSRGSQERPRSDPTTPFFDKSGKILRKPFDDADDGDLDEHSGSIKPIIWVDPGTKIKSLIDPRTGFMIKPNKSTTKKPIRPQTTTAHCNPTSFLSAIRSHPLPSPQRDTPFQPVEPPIPRVPELPDAFDPGHCGHNSNSNLSNIRLDLPAGTNLSVAAHGRISKQALQNAEVVGQVDKKFILAKVSRSDGSGERSLLILIDQHAADERCRVEELMRGYFFRTSLEAGKSEFGARTQTVSKPLRFELSRQEGKLLVRYQRHFEGWGVRYEVFANGEESDRGVTVDIQSLPVSIAERCRVEPRLLVELIRKEIWKLNDNPGLLVGVGGGSRDRVRVRVEDEQAGDVKSKEDDDGVEWVPRFQNCPEGILEMVNSRSCRSAIMFNDSLSKEQCVDLVRRLGQCAFPFQCAHGRPSMVPIVDIGGSYGQAGLLGARLLRGDARVETPREFTRGLKKWAEGRRSEKE